jgi:hypothetical protein
VSNELGTLAEETVVPSVFCETDTANLNDLDFHTAFDPMCFVHMIYYCFIMSL